MNNTMLRLKTGLNRWFPNQRDRLFLGLSILLCILLAVIPLFGIGLGWIQILFTFFIYLSLSQMWNLLAGYGGLISLAQPAFIGLSAYVVAILLWVGWPIPIALAVLLGGLGAGLLAALISRTVFKFGGLYFAIGTLMLPVILRYWFNSWTPDPAQKVGSGAGFALKTSITLEQFYWIGLLVAVISTSVVFILLKSKYGLAVRAIRDDTVATASSGVNVFNVKLALFVICAFVTGLVGAVYYMYIGYIEPGSAYGMTWTINQIVPVVLGGIGTIAGPFIGTAIFITLYFAFSGDPAVDLFIKGSIVVIVLLIAPEGIMGLLRKYRKTVVSQLKRAKKGVMDN